MLKNSNISVTEQKKNPQAVIEVLKWYESKDKDKGFKYMTMGESRLVFVYTTLYSLSTGSVVFDLISDLRCSFVNP